MDSVSKLWRSDKVTPKVEAVPAHLVYLVLSAFLIVYALFSELIRNRLHLSEPPLATLIGIIFGNLVLDVMDTPDTGRWHRSDRVVQEISRVIVGIQCFTVGINLPAGYLRRHWRSIAILLGPNMVFGWFISATIVWVVLEPKYYSTALIIAACLTPTDPVLSASVLGETKFSQRVPRRLKQLLAAESGGNDGTAFPFMYAVLLAVTMPTAGQALKAWLIDVVLWECLVGIVIGVSLGHMGNKALKFSESKGFVDESNLLAYSILLATLMVGVGSTLGMDVFLVSFAAGAAFGWDGWFAARTRDLHLQNIVDLVLNSAMFVYFGTIIPWSEYTGHLSPTRMIMCVILVLMLKRLPVVLALKPLIKDLHTLGEALFAGHFGPIGIGGLFLAVEARARLETGGSIPYPSPPRHSKHQEAIRIVWPVVSFVVLGSIVVHGLSALAMFIFGSFFEGDVKERQPLLVGDETVEDQGYDSFDDDG